MPPVRSSVGAAAFALILAGCFDFDATEAGGPGDASVGPPSHDGSAGDSFVLPPIDASPSGRDASADADASTTSSDAGGPDGSTPVDSGPTSYCASITPDGGIFFCDDFDEHALPGAWQTYATMSGSLVESDAAAVSKPNCVDETVDPLPLGQQLDIALRTPLPMPPLPGTLRFGFSLDPVQIDTTANAAIVLAAVDFFDRPGQQGQRYTVELAINIESGAPAMALGEQSSLADGGMPYENHPLPPQQPLPLGAFTDIVLEIDWTAPTTAEAKVLVHGGQELDVPLTMTVTPASLQIGIGTSYVSEPSPTWELRYDNVWFTAP